MIRIKELQRISMGAFLVVSWVSGAKSSGLREALQDDSAEYILEGREERAFFFAEKGDTIYYSNRIVKIAFKQD